MDNKEFNLACAEYMGWKEYHHPIFGQGWLDDEGGFNRRCSFNPATDSNDLDKVIEKMKITVVCLKCDKGWRASSYFREIHSMDENRTTAIIKCVQKVLEKPNE